MALLEQYSFAPACPEIVRIIELSREMAFVSATRQDMHSSIPPEREGHSTSTTSSRHKYQRQFDGGEESKKSYGSVAKCNIEGVQDELKELERRTFQIEGGELMACTIVPLA